MEIFAWFPLIVTIMGVFIAAVFLYIIYAIVRNRRVLRRAGHNPDTIQADLANRVMRSSLLAGSEAKSRGERLAEIEELYSSGAISLEERDRARADILGD